MSAINPLTASAVVLATAATDAVYVMFTSAVVARRRVPAATWSSLWYMLSSFTVISYTNNWIYVSSPPQAPGSAPRAGSLQIESPAFKCNSGLKREFCFASRV